MNKNENSKKIHDLYFEHHKSIDFISSEIGLSKPAILKSLKKDKDLYEAERKQRVAKLDEKKQELYKKIQNMYFDKKLTPIKISEDLNVSRSTVTRALQQSKDYAQEKENRKASNKRHNASDDADIMSDLINKQRRNAIAMSKNKKISNDGIINLNLSHYQYNSEKHALVFNESCGKRPSDVPLIRYL